MAFFSVLSLCTFLGAVIFKVDAKKMKIDCRIFTVQIFCNVPLNVCARGFMCKKHAHTQRRPHCDSNSNSNGKCGMTMTKHQLYAYLQMNWMRKVLRRYTRRIHFHTKHILADLSIFDYGFPSTITEIGDSLSGTHGHAIYLRVRMQNNVCTHISRLCALCIENIFTKTRR